MDNGYKLLITTVILQKKQGFRTRVKVVEARVCAVVLTTGPGTYKEGGVANWRFRALSLRPSSTGFPQFVPTCAQLFLNSAPNLNRLMSLSIQQFLDIVDGRADIIVDVDLFFNFLNRMDSGGMVFTAQLAGDLREA